jgi:hypothetical protein
MKGPHKKQVNQNNFTDIWIGNPWLVTDKENICLLVKSPSAQMQMIFKARMHDMYRTGK